MRRTQWCWCSPFHTLALLWLIVCVLSARADAPIVGPIVRHDQASTGDGVGTDSTASEHGLAPNESTGTSALRGGSDLKEHVQGLQHFAVRAATTAGSAVASAGFKRYASPP
jgi:hypothetical protein